MISKLVEDPIKHDEFRIGQNMRGPRALKGRVSSAVAAEEWYNSDSLPSIRMLRPAVERRALAEETAMTEDLIVTWRVERQGVGSKGWLGKVWTGAGMGR